MHVHVNMIRNLTLFEFYYLKYSLLNGFSFRNLTLCMISSQNWPTALAYYWFLVANLSFTSLVIRLVLNFEDCKYNIFIMPSDSSLRSKNASGKCLIIFTPECGGGLVVGGSGHSIFLGRMKPWNRHMIIFRARN
jgi:hypothetical protein